MTGYIVFAHGSSVEPANEAVRAAAREAARLGRWESYATAFLGGGHPDLPGAAEELLGRGASRLVVIPYFLTPGLHLERDLPALVDRLKRSHPDLEIAVTQSLDGHPALAEALTDRARES